MGTFTPLVRRMKFISQFIRSDKMEKKTGKCRKKEINDIIYNNGKVHIRIAKSYLLDELSKWGTFEVNFFKSSLYLSLKSNLKGELQILAKLKNISVQLALSEVLN